MEAANLHYDLSKSVYPIIDKWDEKIRLASGKEIKKVDFNGYKLSYSIIFILDHVLNHIHIQSYTYLIIHIPKYVQSYS